MELGKIQSTANLRADAIRDLEHEDSSDFLEIARKAVIDHFDTHKKNALRKALNELFPKGWPKDLRERGAWFLRPDRHDFYLDRKLIVSIPVPSYIFPLNPGQADEQTKTD